MTKREVLRATTFGKPTAEEESADLSAYFVETDQWQRIFAGDVDVVYGAKGSGKSALYALLLSRTSELFDRGIIVVAAESPRGAVAFKDLVIDPPTDELQFRSLWKLYFLVLVAHSLREYGITSEGSRRVIQTLEEAQLLPRNASLSGFLHSALSYIRQLMKSNALALETTVDFDPLTSMPSGLTGRIRFREPSSIEESLGLVSVDHLLELTDAALLESGFKIWLVLDRLDVAFAESPELERNALRTLFRVYLDLRKFTAISLKIFLRTDLWMSILTKGFREASHIGRQITISWDEASLMNLVIRRALHNDVLRENYDADLEKTLSDTTMQTDLFYRIFPRRISVIEPMRTFDWILQHISDGSRTTAPRELIHLLSAARDSQLKRLEIGQAPPEDEALFDRSSLIAALPEVSRVRFEQTLCAEFPHLRERMLQLEGERSQQTVDTLAQIWRTDSKEAQELAHKLADIGFFQLNGTRRMPQFWLPYIYQSALKAGSSRR
jgi:hypothetical protein